MTRIVIPPQRGASTRILLVLAIAAVTAIVVATLQLGGAIEGGNRWAESLLRSMLGEAPTRQMPGWLPWSAAAVLALGLPALLLAIHCAWQRWIVWTLTMGLLILWVPVLALASCRAELSAPCLVSLCAGLLALYWAGGSHKARR